MDQANLARPARERQPEIEIPAVWLPFQDVTATHHIAQWVEIRFAAPPSGLPGRQSGLHDESCAATVWAADTKTNK